MLDVAIGAPYEEGGGSVYIYNGYNGGLWPKHSQRISASTLNTGLLGFGISLSNAADLNSDGINGIFSLAKLTTSGIC